MHTLTEPELSIMLTLWQTEQPVPRVYIQQKLEHLSWKTNTFNTYLGRLQDKGFLASECKGNTYYYRPLIPQDAYMEQEGSSILGRLFGGSLKNFVVSVSNTEAVDESDLEELRSLLDQMKGGKSDVN
ncbi:MAG: BlaI/MecI/CopY family transcriptional regulator [Oscillospiraceae bacterium]